MLLDERLNSHNLTFIQLPFFVIVTALHELHQPQYDNTSPLPFPFLCTGDLMRNFENGEVEFNGRLGRFGR